MNIYLCGRNICMSHHGLNVFYGSTALQKVHGKRMTQRVRRNLLRDAGLRCIRPVSYTHLTLPTKLEG